MELLGSNVVVSANHFNPSIVNQSWLVKHKIVAEDEIVLPTIFAEGLSQVQTAQFFLLVVPQMLQFVTKPGQSNQDEASLVATKLGAFVSNLPHTPYTAIGLNFTWNVTPEDETIRDLTRRLFFKGDVAPFSLFDIENAHFGAYMSKDFGNVRLKLDIKPVVNMVADGQKEDRLMFAFNFNKDLSQDSAVPAIVDTLSIWNDAKAESEKIVALAMKRGAK